MYKYKEYGLQYMLIIKHLLMKYAKEQRPNTCYFSEKKRIKFRQIS